jgi:hypothetical protein
VADQLLVCVQSPSRRARVVIETPFKPHFKNLAAEKTEPKQLARDAFHPEPKELAQDAVHPEPK